ncbi:MAG: hypothetical protein ACK5L8_02870 [Marinicella pacifica]
MKYLLIVLLGLLVVTGFGSVFSTSKAVTSPNACYHVTNGTVDPAPFAFIPPHSYSCPPIPAWVHANIDEDNDKNHPEDWDDDSPTTPPPSNPTNHGCDVIVQAAPQ